MKHLLTLAFLFSCLIAITAQNDMVYETLIADDNGIVIRHRIIDLRFTIIAETGPIKVYQEIHSRALTNDNGMVKVIIGEGISQLNSFSDIDFASDVHTLKAEVDLEQNGAFVNLGTSRIVGPKGAENGLNSNSSGYRNSNGAESIAMGYNPTASGIRSTAMGNNTNALGHSSTAMGAETYASAFASTSMGDFTQASGIGSTAMGRNTIASGNASTAVGNFSEAAGSFSTAIGYGTEAASHGETVIGTFNERYTAIDSVGFNENDRLFVVGNGVLISRSNALVVQKNGTITAPSFDMSEITDDKALVTKEYMDANASVLEALNEGQGLGYRVRGRNPAHFGDIGYNAVDFSFSNFETKPYGATGPYSTAMGIYTIASGNSSIAGGGSTTASGQSSVAMGTSTKASGSVSTAFGVHTTAPSFAETVIGTYNKDYVPLRDDIIELNDRLFVIGNGTGPGNFQSNALTVLKNGNTGFVTTIPLAKIHISEGNDTGLGTNNGFLLLGESNSTNISIDNNEIMAKDNGVAADLNLQIEGGNVLIGGNVGIGTINPAEKLHVDGIVRIGTETIEDTGLNLLSFDASVLPTVDNGLSLGTSGFRWTTVFATDGTINTSDRREKKNIAALEYGLTEVLEMKPVSFNWKDKNHPDLKLGLIAQDLQALIPEVVKSHTLEIEEASGDLIKKELDRLGVYYSDLVPVLIKAIQEQQEIIDAQNTKIDNIERKLDALLGLNAEENMNK